MKNTLQSLAVLAAVICLSNCTTYVAPTTPSEPSSATVTTSQTTASPAYTGDSVTTKRTTTTYR